MSRVQLALNVADVGEAVAFYSKLFATEPNKIRPGYANFAIDEPPLKLVLIENADAASALNHLGVEVASTNEVVDARSRLFAAGLVTADENSVECCYALQDKIWVGSPDGEPWEIYTVISDVETAGGLNNDAHAEIACCSTGEEIGLSISKCC